MNAGQLIEELKKLPPETKLYVRDTSYGTSEVEEVWVNDEQGNKQFFVG